MIYKMHAATVFNSIYKQSKATFAVYVLIDVNVVANHSTEMQRVAVMRCLACLVSIPSLVYSSQDLAFTAMRTATVRLVWFHVGGGMWWFTS